MPAHKCKCNSPALDMWIHAETHNGEANFYPASDCNFFACAPRCHRDSASWEFFSKYSPRGMHHRRSDKLSVHFTSLDEMNLSLESSQKALSNHDENFFNGIFQGKTSRARQIRFPCSTSESFRDEMRLSAASDTKSFNYPLQG